MTNTNAWLYANSFGQNHFGYANRPIQVNQLCSYAPNIATTAMKPNFQACNDDRPLIEFLNNPPIEECLGYPDPSRSTDPNASEALEEDIFDFTPFLDMSNIDLMNHALPDSLDIEQLFDIANQYSSQLTTAEGGVQGITHDIPDEPPTPTRLPPEDGERQVVITKRVVQSKRKQPAKRQRRPRPRRERGNRSIHLWEFLQEMLNNSEDNANYIKWISKREGVFQLVNSSGVAKLWGQRKNRKNMTYEKMSRALRYYYEKDILERVPNARLIYKFGGKTKQKADGSGEHADDSLSDSSEN